jgi:hypothetical protein
MVEEGDRAQICCNHFPVLTLTPALPEAYGQKRLEIIS